MYSLELSAELAVLSACDTFKGELRTDGVVGVARSFLAAGVSSLAVSLWKVDDRATKELMVQFYARFVAGEGAAAAMRGAMRAMIRAGCWTPKQWAGFVVYGLPGAGASEAPSAEFVRVADRLRAELELPSDTTPLDVLLRAEEELGTQVEAGSSLVQRAERAAAELGV